MRKLKKVFCLLAVITVASCLTACKKKDNIEKGILKGFNYSLVDEGKSAYAAKEIDVLKGKIITRHSYPFIVMENAEKLLDIYSYNYQGVGDCFVNNLDKDTMISINNLENESYVTLSFSNGEKMIYDSYGGIVVERDIYGGLYIDSYYGFFTDDETVFYEEITFLDGSYNETTKFYSVKFDKENFTNIREEIKESDVAQGKIGDYTGNYGDGERIYLGDYSPKLKGYQAIKHGESAYYILDEKGKLVIDIEESDNGHGIFVGDKFIYQSVNEVSKDDDYDTSIINEYYFYMTGEFKRSYYKNKTVSYNLSNGKSKEIDTSISLLYGSEDWEIIKYNGYYQYLRVVQIDSSRDGKVFDYSDQRTVYICNSDLEVVLSGDKADFISRSDEIEYIGNNRYIISDETDQFWLVDENGKEITTLSYYYCSPSGGVIAAYNPNVDDYCFIDYNGKIIDGKAYSTAYTLKGGYFYASCYNEEGKKESYVICFKDGKKVSSILLSENTDAVGEVQRKTASSFIYELEHTSDSEAVLRVLSFDNEELYTANIDSSSLSIYVYVSDDQPINYLTFIKKGETERTFLRLYC